MERIKIKQPSDCLELLKAYERKHQEHFGIICLDGGYNVLAKKVLFVGGTSRALVDTKIVLWTALEKKSTAVILFHNHPSGDTTPSIEDMETTEHLRKALSICGMKLLDHMIIGKYSYFSFLERDLIDNGDEKTLVAER